MNIYDIAELAGVSIATVSRVVNGSDKVSPRTREKVLRIIEQNGYTPNIFAQGLGIGTVHSVGILVPDISDLFMADAVSSLERMLRDRGYNCLLSASGFDREDKEKHTQLLLSKKVDALILVGSTYAGSGKDAEETDYIRAAAQQVPVFLINGSVKGKNIYSCVCDDHDAVFQVTAQLLDRGRRRILFMTDSGSYSALRKRAGYEDALRAAGLAPDPALFLRLPNRIHPVRDLLLQWHRESPAAPLFDAVIATDDGMAVGAVKYAAAAGLRVPEDLEIVGYNNSYLSVACEPELTSVDNHLAEMCRHTVDHLLAVLAGSTDHPINSMTGWSLAVRRTTQNSSEST